MKKMYWYVFVLLLPSVCCVQCTREGDDLHPGKIQFAVNLNSSGGSAGNKIASDLPAGASIIVSIETSSGDDVLTFEKVTLLKVGDQFISEPVGLHPGNYNLTEFFVISENNEVLFATPKKGSDLAYLVEDPLPISFTVENNQTENLNMEVVDARDNTPEDLGYVSFNVEVVHSTLFALSVFALNENGAELTSAEALIIFDGDDTVKIYDVEPWVNQFVFDENTDKVFGLVVRKEGYKTYQHYFESFAIFHQALNGKPFSVQLEPIDYGAQLKIRNHTYGGEWGFGIGFPEDRPRTIFYFIDWGDGTTEEIISEESEYWKESGIFLRHEYDTMGEYDIVIFGDLDKIHTLSPEPLTDIDLRSLYNLEVFFTQQGGFAPASIDFTGNPKIEEIRVPSTFASEFRFSDVNTNVQRVEISVTHFSTESIDYLIQHIYTMAKLHNHYNGNFDYSYTIPEIVGPPSEEKMEMLRELQNNYNWDIHPAP